MFCRIEFGARGAGGSLLLLLSHHTTRSHLPHAPPEERGWGDDDEREEWGHSYHRVGSATTNDGKKLTLSITSTHHPSTITARRQPHGRPQWLCVARRSEKGGKRAATPSGYPCWWIHTPARRPPQGRFFRHAPVVRRRRRRLTGAFVWLAARMHAEEQQPTRVCAQVADGRPAPPPDVVIR